MRKQLTFFLALGALLCTTGPLCAEGDRTGVTYRELVTPQIENCINKGLQYLARSQNRNGRWLSNGNTGSYGVAMTGLAGLALMSEGSTVSTGRYSKQIRRAVEYLLSSADPKTGVFKDKVGRTSMHAHGFAMMFMAEAYGSEPYGPMSSRLKIVLTRAVSLTCKSQSTGGGWFYTPNSNNDEGSVTVTQIQGLRACANAGIYVPKETIAKAVKYIEICQRPDGGIAYSYRSRGGSSRPPITCAALATLYNAGKYESAIIEKARKYVEKTVWPKKSGRGVMGHYYYAHFYLAQDLYRPGGVKWKNYYRHISSKIVKDQQGDGSIKGDHVGKVYGTAIGLIILQLPGNYVPIFQP